MKYTKKQVTEAIAYWKKQLGKRRVNESNSHGGTVYDLMDEIREAVENLEAGLSDVDREIKAGNLENASEAIDHMYNLYYDLAKFFGR